MDPIELPYFGHFTGDDIRKQDVLVGGNNIGMDLNLNQQGLTERGASYLNIFLKNLEEHAVKNRQFIDEYYDEADEENALKFYLDFHKEEALEEMQDALNVDPTADDLNLQLIAKLKLARVGLYPNNANFFAIFDYTFGKDFTNYVLVLITDAAGNIQEITVES
ncbi:DUF2004 domain-containing protein [Chitinophaga sp. Hz27]|uniref:DUF2004 domain-containing protein n=1 Tax=Chitinophaga sp. Hz27 TaxID=3347169 RepID=UPI0035DBE4E4